ncbi:MAG TPA: hypothetical protein VHL78_09975 [Actinomycetota bacterium]|nr:hypothetical protein [Actinomycetota bacterium]
MSETPSQVNGAVRWRPAVPTVVVVISVIVAVGAVSGLLFLLYNRTRGPGEILREFALRVDAGDCAGSYRLLDASATEEIDEARWCDLLDRVDRAIDADFDLQQATLRGDVAVVRIEGPPVRAWRLARHGNSWRVLVPPELVGFA